MAHKLPWLLFALPLLAISWEGSPKPPRKRGGAMLSIEQLRALARMVGFADPNTAAAIAMVESGGNVLARLIVTREQADAYNAAHLEGPRHGPERSFGLWQINTLANPQFSETRLLDGNYNARAALALSKGGTYWRPWSTYNDGKYLKYMPPAVS